jgi:hypothetical protein
MLQRRALPYLPLWHRAPHRFTVTEAAAVDDGCKVFVHWTAQGTNTGHVRDRPPSGKPVRFSGVTLLKLDAGGRIQESWVYRWVCC